jgi:hypothetical protein
MESTQYYRPFTCWLQPIKLSEFTMRLYAKESDPYKLGTRANLALTRNVRA